MRSETSKKKLPSEYTIAFPKANKMHNNYRSFTRGNRVLHLGEKSVKTKGHTHPGSGRKFRSGRDQGANPEGIYIGMPKFWFSGFYVGFIQIQAARDLRRLVRVVFRWRRSGWHGIRWLSGRTTCNLGDSYCYLYD